MKLKLRLTKSKFKLAMECPIKLYYPSGYNIETVDYDKALEKIR